METVVREVGALSWYLTGDGGSGAACASSSTN